MVKPVKKEDKVDATTDVPHKIVDIKTNKILIYDPIGGRQSIKYKPAGVEYPLLVYIRKIHLVLGTEVINGINYARLQLNAESEDLKLIEISNALTGDSDTLDLTKNNIMLLDISNYNQFMSRSTSRCNYTSTYHGIEDFIINFDSIIINDDTSKTYIFKLVQADVVLFDNNNNDYTKTNIVDLENPTLRPQYQDYIQKIAKINFKK